MENTYEYNLAINFYLKKENLFDKSLRRTIRF